MRIFDFVPVTRTSGEVGIEIEAEGHMLPAPPTAWRQEHDGSLRGNSCEYVLKKPVMRHKINDYLGRMAKAYEVAGTEIVESPRQSIHVHINVQDMTITQIFNFICLFYMVEAPLVDFCGKERVSNLFCLRSCDAPGIFTALEKASETMMFKSLNTDMYRYAALNVASLFKYGSLEFRSMRGTADFDLIERWINILLKIKDRAMIYKTPDAIVESMSMKSPEVFVEEMLGTDYDIIFEYPDWQEYLMEAVRDFQMIAYRGQWEKFSSGEEKYRHPPKEEFKLPPVRDGGFVMEDGKLRRVKAQIVPHPDDILDDEDWAGLADEFDDEDDIQAAAEDLRQERADARLHAARVKEIEAEGLMIRRIQAAAHKERMKAHANKLDELLDGVMPPPVPPAEPKPVKKKTAKARKFNGKVKAKAVPPWAAFDIMP